MAHNCKSLITKLSFEEAKNFIDQNPGVTIADVREEHEYITGHVIDSINLPLSELVDYGPEEGQAYAEELVPDKSAPLMVYCRTGKRSAEAAQALAEYGYTQIYDMGSLAKWPYGLSYE